jgi:hypothetical protein
MKRAVPLGKTKISEIDESVKTIINDPNSFISSKTTGGTTGGVKPLSTTNVKMLSKVESRLGNYVNYMKDGKIYSHPDPAKVNKVLQKVTINGVYDPTKVKALSSTEFDDLLKIINEGTFTDNRLNPKSLINELNKYGTKKYPNYKGFVNPGTPATATTTGTTGQATTAATTSSVKHMKIDEYDNVIKSFDDQIGKYDKSIKAIDDKIAQIETSGGRFNRSIFGRMGAKKEIEKLKATKSANIKSKESLEKLKSSLTNNVKKVNNPSGPGQVMQVSDDAVNDISKFSRSSGSTTIRKASTRWSKFKNFSSGFVRGMFCGILGNIAGANKLKEKGLIGLDNSILIPQDFKFEKNTLYEIGILDVSNKENQKNRYKLDITKFSPNLTNINLDQRIDNCGIKTT